MFQKRVRRTTVSCTMFWCLHVGRRWWWKHTRTAKLTSTFNRIKFKPPLHSTSSIHIFPTGSNSPCIYIFFYACFSFVHFTFCLTSIYLCLDRFISLFRSFIHTYQVLLLHQFAMHVCNLTQVLAAQQHQTPYWQFQRHFSNFKFDEKKTRGRKKYDGGKMIFFDEMPGDA